MKFTIIKSCLAHFSGIFALGTPSNIHGTAISYCCAKFGAFVSSVTILTLRDLTNTFLSLIICSNWFYLQQIFFLFAAIIFYLQQLLFICSKFICFAETFLFAACPLWATVLNRGKRKSFRGKLHL